MDDTKLLEVLIILYFFGVLGIYGQAMGPFDFTVNGVEECSDIGEGKFKFAFKMYRQVRKSITIDASVNMTIPLDDSLTIRGHIAQFTNGGWKNNFFIKDFPRACSTLKFLLPDFIEVIRKAANISASVTDKCPFPKGYYSGKKILVSFEFKGIPVFIYNKYRGEAIFLKDGKRIGCVRYYADVFPKRKQKSKGRK